MLLYALSSSVPFLNASHSHKLNIAEERQQESTVIGKLQRSQRRLAGMQYAHPAARHAEIVFCVTIANDIASMLGNCRHLVW